MKVITVALSRIDDDPKMVAFVRPIDISANGIQGCIEIDLKMAFKLREQICQRIPTNGEWVDFDKVKAFGWMGAEERFAAVQIAKAFFAFSDEEQTKVGSLEVRVLTVAEIADIRGTLLSEKRDLKIGGAYQGSKHNSQKRKEDEDAKLGAEGQDIVRKDDSYEETSLDRHST